MIELVAWGEPIPQGSKRLGKIGSRFVVLDDNDRALKPWRATIAGYARAALSGGARQLDGPLRLVADFTLARPKSVKKRQWPTARPDLSKLVRAVEDSLTDAGLWVDDSRVVELFASKRYVGDGDALDRPGVRVCVVEL